jgi:two-component system NtrC family sensor kinase
MAAESGPSASPLPFKEGHYRDIKRRTITRLIITYLGPLLVLAIYFYFQYDSMATEGKNLHLKAIAENQANTLDLYLSERLVNLSNLIDDPKFEIPPASETMNSYLHKLKSNSEAFVDIGYFDSSGVQATYAGPYQSLEKRNYCSEAWYKALKASRRNYIITDIYLGFRHTPHFTMAVSRIINGQFIVLRATLSPEKFYEYISSLEGSHEVNTSLVNRQGDYQVVASKTRIPPDSFSAIPPDEPRVGIGKAEINKTAATYAYSWLRTADWALIVQWSSAENQGLLTDYRLRIFGATLVIVILFVLVIINRAGKLIEFQKESDRTRAQLEHAAKLASVGELAAGIAHEINNPLAIISEEAGLMKDLMSSEFGEPVKPNDLTEHLDNIQESVFRCRNITRKLLGFVRKSSMDLKPYDVNKLIDGVLDGFLSHEMTISNIEIIRDYGPDIPRLVTDSNQFQQVLLNIINNAADALESRPGKITVTTSLAGDNVNVAVSDTGKGMNEEQLSKIFMPFYTTKVVGKGTGLGLSVSYGIIKSLGGKIKVDSTLGKGSTFTIVMPVHSLSALEKEPMR